MRRGLLAVPLGFFLSLSMTVAEAREPYKIDGIDTTTYDSIKQEWESIPNYLQDAQCGGWDLSQSVAGKVATISGVLGHSGKWDGAILSGMATRTDEKKTNSDFQFPDQATGLVTDCWAGSDGSVHKPVWRDIAGNSDVPPTDPIQKIDVVFPYPVFQDPACRWRRMDENEKYFDTAPSIPLQPVSSYDPPPQYGEMQKPDDGIQIIGEPGDRQGIPNCMDFSNYLNTFQYRDCLQTEIVGASIVCLRWDSRYVCSNAPLSPQPTDNESPTSGLPNSFVCTGQQCRCQQDGGPLINRTSQCIKDQNGDPYYSYYRSYTATTQRDPVASDGPADNTLSDTKIPVACYGFYNEFDPQTHQTQPQDRRCVIKIDVSSMRDSQEGKGNYGDSTGVSKPEWESSKISDKDPLSKENQRQKKNDQLDLWYMKLGSSISFLNEDVFQKDKGGDLTNVYLDIDNLDSATQEGSWPVSRQGSEPHIAKSDQLRAFDDTGDKRIVVGWWQKQQTEVASALHPTVLRLLLPPGYAFGVDPSDPLINPSVENRTDLTIDQRSKRIEIQIGASEDLLGEVLGYVERSFLLHLNEEPIPLIVPMESPTELRATAQAWCSWYMKKNAASSCNGAPANVRDYIDKLEAYADQVENIRELRAQLASYAGRVMQLQQSLTKPISEWMKTNLESYQAFLKEQQTLTQGIEQQWREAQTAMSAFHDATNMPWCMNQRFETPISSLLDTWLPSRALSTNTSSDGRISADELPNLTVPRASDITIDLSGFTYMTGSLALPVLKPVQVRLDIETPSENTQDGPEHPLPNFPNMDAVTSAMEQSMKNLPNVVTNAALAPLPLPENQSGQTATILETMQQITNTVRSMNERYDKFWKSIGPLTLDPNAPAYDPTKECTSETIKNRKEHRQCCSFDDDVCQHVEMDLIERIQRIASRKLVFLKEDYASAGIERGAPDSCLPSDDVCLLLHGESAVPRYQWQIDGPKTMPDLSRDARKAVRDATLPTPIGSVAPATFPPYDASMGTIVPVYDVPRLIDLSPPKK